MVMASDVSPVAQLIDQGEDRVNVALSNELGRASAGEELVWAVEPQTCVVRVVKLGKLRAEPFECEELVKLGGLRIDPALLPTRHGLRSGIQQLCDFAGSNADVALD
jgi:hypothetical protein